MYEQTLSRIGSQAEEDVELAEMVLFWIVCARRPLTVLELQQMYAMRTMTDGDDDDDILTLDEDDLPDGDSLTGVCGGLVIVNGDSGVVRLVHYTAQQYFETAHASRLPTTKIEITKISLSYLTLSNFSAGICDTDVTMSERLRRFPFLQYASCFWGSESSNIDYSVLWPAVRRFVENTVAVEVANQAQGIPFHRSKHWSQEIPRAAPALVVVASFDLPDILRRLVADGYGVLEETGSDRETPLIRAASRGLSRNVEALLGLGAAVNVYDYAGETAIHRAVGRGDEDTVKLLLSAGADIKITAAANWTVLMSAVSSGRLEAVRLLVEAGAQLDANTEWGDSALSLATRNGQEAIANYLADAGSTLPNSIAGGRASVVASRKGLAQLVRRLTADYVPVARMGLWRQGLDARPVLSGLREEDSGAAEGGGEATRGEGTHWSEVFDGLEYARGFRRRYQLLQFIGKGNSADVYGCKDQVTGVVYAVKVFNVQKALEARYNVSFMRDFHHPAIVRAVNIFAPDETEKIYLVMELVVGGELFDYIIANEKVSEKQTRKVFLQLLSAVNFMVGSIYYLSPSMRLTETNSTV